MVIFYIFKKNMMITRLNMSTFSQVEIGAD